ncbi:hypothetical protein [Sphingobacterium sp.]|uniref:hypothetical protein n=1 Tax=Sphingobacterium sp. TaxID=341027 RepID=UPI00289D4AC6|nr:hypothetical protein [Sphingobacterium sp.]
MKENKKKELIEEIIGQLKNHELPYKEGSWEKFASDYGVSSRGSSNWKYWSAAAAVLLCFGAGYWSLKNNVQTDSPSMVKEHRHESAEVLGNNKDLKESIQRSLSAITQDNGAASKLLSLKKPFTYSTVATSSSEAMDKHQLALNSGQLMQGHDVSVSNDFGQLRSMQLKNSNFSANISLNENEAAEAAVAPASRVAAAQSNPFNISSGNQTQREAAKLSQLYAAQHGNVKNSVVINKTTQEKKWEMGAFVSPASTSESITLGGGVALAYNLSSKVSLRSGASIQHYGAVSGNTPITPALGSNSFNADAPNYISQSSINNSFVMRTADAKDAKSNERVSGKILTVDIPVDVRYAISKNFYTSVGVSYVGVLDQERATIYETNNTEYKQKSTDKNVDDKGVNGFINFSVGRKQKVGKLSISVEPYYKAPIGGLKSSDLNYSNGGVKIITSF